MDGDSDAPADVFFSEADIARVGKVLADETEQLVWFKLAPCGLRCACVRLRTGEWRISNAATQPV